MFSKKGRRSVDFPDGSNFGVRILAMSSKPEEVGRPALIGVARKGLDDVIDNTEGIQRMRTESLERDDLEGAIKVCQSPTYRTVDQMVEG